MPSRLARPIWDPSTVLSLDPSHHQTCVGWASSKGRQCKIRIAARNLTLASSVLDDLSKTPLSERRRIKGLLEELAECMLCVRWHQDQNDEVTEEWKMKIWPETTPTTREVPVNPAPANRTTHSPRPDNPSPPPTRARTPTPPPAYQEEPVTPTRAPPARELRMRSPSPASTTLPSTPPPAYQEEPVTPTRAPSARELRMQSLSPASVPLPPSPPPYAPTPQTPPVAKATRKTIEADSQCPICKDTLIPEDQPIQLAWCKAECGQNVHAECWVLWEHHQIGEDGDLMEAKCAICRAVWVN